MAKSTFFVSVVPKVMLVQTCLHVFFLLSFKYLFSLEINKNIMAGYPPPGQPGYPPAQPGYPPAGQPGYPPPGQPGYPPPGQPGYQQPVMQQPGAPGGGFDYF